MSSSRYYIQEGKFDVEYPENAGKYKGDQLLILFCDSLMFSTLRLLSSRLKFKKFLYLDSLISVKEIASEQGQRYVFELEDKNVDPHLVLRCATSNKDHMMAWLKAINDVILSRSDVQPDRPVSKQVSQ